MEPGPEVERCWVTVVGTSPMAVVNSIWRACELEVVPQRVVLLASPDVPRIQESVAVVWRHLQAVLPRFGVASPHLEVRPIDEGDFQGFRATLGRVLEEERRRAAHVVIDTTPGRKYMSAFAIAQGRRTDLHLEHVYYNHLLDQQRYGEVPHPLIPRHEQHLYDLLEVLGR